MWTASPAFSVSDRERRWRMVLCGRWVASGTGLESTAAAAGPAGTDPAPPQPAGSPPQGRPDRCRPAHRRAGIRPPPRAGPGCAPSRPGHRPPSSSQVENGARSAGACRGWGGRGAVGRPGWRDPSWAGVPVRPQLRQQATPVEVVVSGGECLQPHAASALVVALDLRRHQGSPSTATVGRTTSRSGQTGPSAR